MPTSPLPPRSIDTPRPLSIGIIGAGVSGIGLYIRLQQYIPHASITIWEKNPDVGGTWFENRYPGVKCDIPSHVYQYTFEPNTQWSEFFSGGAEILEYVRGVSKKYGVREKVRFGTRVMGCEWREEEGVWVVRSVQGEKGEETEERVNVLVNATGVLNNWKMPDVEGLEGFEGRLMHSANWDPTWDYSNLNVALIGVGSSAIQILPHLQKKCTKVYQFARGKTWISEPFGGKATMDTIASDRESGNYTYTSEEKTRYKDDPEFYHSYRKHIERFINLDHPCLFADTEQAIGSKQRIIANMKEKLKTKPDIFEMLQPDFSPGCRRLTPGPGFLEALVEENVEFTNSRIVRATKDSIITADGKERKVDAIVCATGFNTSFLPRFPITGQNGAKLSKTWDNQASAYLSLAIPSFPNYAVIGGPNSATGGGSLLIIFESIIGYIVKCIQKLSREHIKTMTISQHALQNWSKYCDAYFPTTVHVEGCTSWYKAGEKEHKVVGLWPGSSGHARAALEFPRWEDWKFEYEGGEDSELAWLGDGWTRADREAGETSRYLDEIDYPPVPGV